MLVYAQFEKYNIFNKLLKIPKPVYCSSFLIKTNRCIVKLEQKDVSKKIERYMSIAKEASEQSRRQIIPSIVGVFDINKLPKEYLGDINLFAYEKDSGQFSSLENIKGHSISCLIGPEGGINEEEANSLLNQGFTSISLGKRILRAETAAINLLSVIQYNIEK